MNNWKIPLFASDYGHAEAQAVAEVIQSKWLTMGEATSRFEGQLEKYLGTGARCVAVSNGTAALHLALMSAGIGTGDEVVISALSFVAALNVTTLVGARPVLADCKSLDDWNVSHESIARAITPKTKAIIIVHYSGQPCDMDEIRGLADRHGLVLIEDTAHAIGAEYKGLKCGTMGQFGCFSFFSNKNLSVGEGGLVVARDEGHYQRLRLLRSHGMTSMTIDRHNKKSLSYDVMTPGLNYRIDEIRSALGIVQLGKLDSNNAKRKALSQTYAERLQALPDISHPWAIQPQDRLSSYHIFPVLLAPGHDRKAIMQHMRDAGVQTSIHYPSYRSFTYYSQSIEGESAIADEISSRVLTLPLYPGMTEADIDTVCNALAGATKQ